MHILRVANFVSPTSGGIKTALRHWGEGYRARGHQVSLIIPATKGDEPVTEESQGTVYRVPATAIPGTGYSLMWSRARLGALMDRINPDSLEVSDRSTTRWMGRWARRRDIGSIMISHENMTGIMVRRTPVPDVPAVWMADFINTHSANDYDAIVCPSRFAAEEFHRLGVPARIVDLGVDLDVFHPDDSYEHLTPGGRVRTEDEGLHIIHCGRLAPEKNPQLSIETLRHLVRGGVRAHLTVLGHGPLRDELIEKSQDLPVTFHAYINSRSELAAVMRRADVAIAPGPLETFGLAALEALACGVPTVCPDEGALAEVVRDGGIAAPSDPAKFADAVLTLSTRPDARRLAREQAETFSWEHSSDEMLAIHGELAVLHSRR
ncbi:glycosyltransferase family 1 protein [Ornithinimicrobium ciconiae]|uniref:D-inositol 3-phosphate glycosyltransferase n=1 Tax=Ornithinimicrobium ciconiae TaxID=2594265 RepID=A0A516GBU1_9MICO|nr:glycosyltransferase [Ornithinimicrobium ciconiae]QDO88991.1 glycosyltransferase family 1 protein [Ornithinimicrobium ciconiae]